MIQKTLLYTALELFGNVSISQVLVELLDVFIVVDNEAVEVIVVKIFIRWRW